MRQITAILLAGLVLASMVTSGVVVTEASSSFSEAQSTADDTDWSSGFSMSNTFKSYWWDNITNNTSSQFDNLFCLCSSDNNTTNNSSLGLGFKSYWWDNVTNNSSAEIGISFSLDSVSETYTSKISSYTSAGVKATRNTGVQSVVSG